MRILLLAHSFNSLTQRLYVELTERKHELSLELDIHDAVTCEAVELFDPQIVLAPFLKRPIPEKIWRTRRCLIVHPGVPGDRGPSALDWAILRGEREWGVTVLEAEGELDAGPIWAHERFAMRAGTKSSLYRAEVAEAAVAAVLAALERIAASAVPVRIVPESCATQARFRPLCRAADRVIDWRSDSTETVLRKIRSADGSPGVTDTLFDQTVRLYDAHAAYELHGEPGTVIARCGSALARATCDGAVWLGHVQVLHSAVQGQDSRPVQPRNRSRAGSGPNRPEVGPKLATTSIFDKESAGLPMAQGHEPIWYEEHGPVGLLHFAFYNGAMSTAQCVALREAYAKALARSTRVLVLVGGSDYWSNGIHLGVIEAAESPAEEAWQNINAIDDLAHDIIATTDRIVISAMRGGAGAGGVFLALAADEVWAVAGVVLNPHYKDMGNLYGSEYWTYLLPRRVEAQIAQRLMQGRRPMGVEEALRVGLIDSTLPIDARADSTVIARRAAVLAREVTLEARIANKRRRREADERIRPLEAYRTAELARMHRNFFGFDPSFHVARYNFIYKIAKSRTPLHLARHRAPQPLEGVRVSGKQ